MPSSRPLPARRIETSASLRPASIGAFISVSGVLDRLARHRQFPGDLVGEQHRDFAQELPEDSGRAGRLVAHQRQLVAGQGRVIDDREVRVGGSAGHGELPEIAGIRYRVRNPG